MEAEERVAATTGDGDRELTVDELAARVGITVRNVRAYAARGLLPPPRLVGRTGYYGPEHVTRLLLVREMLAEGYSLAVIERTLATAPAVGGSAALALHRALLAPWLPPEPEETTPEELAARAGVPVDAATVDEMVRLGLVERLDDGRLRVNDPPLLTAGLQVVQLGVPPSALIAAQARVIELVREIAATYVGMFVETGWRALLEEGARPDRLDRVRAMVDRLQPAAAQALLASFRTEMAAAVGAAVQAELGALAEE
ncbi:MerR family transcriptional regulator [Geodermatophilus sp. SYSU D01045]